MSKGVAAARISILRDSWVGGNLHPAFASILDTFEDGWREDPAQRRWNETYLDFMEWVNAHGRIPEAHDMGAVGLRPWFDAQQKADLDDRQIRLLERCAEWTGLTTPSAAGQHAILASLHAHGVKPSRARDRNLMPAFAAMSNPADVPADINWGEVNRTDLAKLASYLIFVAQHQRQPSLTEPSGKWIVGVRGRDLLTASLAAALSSVPDWQDSSDPAFDRGAAQYETYLVRNKRQPSARSTDKAERASAGWRRRQRARADALGEKQKAVLASLSA